MADLDPSELTVDELRDELDGIDDAEILEEIREAEADGEDRTGAIEAIDDRLESVSDDQQAEADGSGEGTSAGIVEIRNHVRDSASDLIGRPLDSIIEIERNEGDWHALVEIIERNSVPDTQDILGRYALELDGGGEITGYRRLDRYRRGDTRREEAGASEPPY